MHVYIAAKFSHRKILRELIPRLRAIGIEVTSRWIVEDEQDFLYLPNEALDLLAQRDIEDIESAEVVILDTTEPLAVNAGAGREWEAGLGFAQHGIFWRVGPRRNVFHGLASSEWESWEDFLKEATWRN